MHRYRFRGRRPSPAPPAARSARHVSRLSWLRLNLGGPSKVATQCRAYSPPRRLLLRPGLCCTFHKVPQLTAATNVVISSSDRSGDRLVFVVMHVVFAKLVEHRQDSAVRADERLTNHPGSGRIRRRRYISAVDSHSKRLSRTRISATTSKNGQSERSISPGPCATY